MAVPSYTTDLNDISLAQSATGWAESSDANWDDGGTPVADADYPFIQDTLSISQPATKVGIASAIYNNGSSITIPTDGAFLVWQIFTSPGAMDTYANGGMRVVVGSAINAFYAWDTGGRDFGRMPYGGWQNVAVNPTVAVDDTVGTPTNQQFVGSAVAVTTAIGKGNPHAVDAMRYGRCEARINGGEGPSNYATFAGFAAANDATAARWGLLQGIPGGYLWKGLMTLGYTSAVDFRDSNTQVLVDDTRKVTANFNKIEVRQATSRVDWTNITFKSLGTVSKGRLEVVDDCDVNISGCVFEGFDTIVFKASSAALTSTFRNCRQITANGAEFDGSVFSGYEGTADTGYLVWNVATDINGKLDGCSFAKGTAATHAIEFGTSAPTSMTMTNMAFSGYNASNGQSDSTLYFADKGSDTTWTITLSGTSQPSYKKARAGDTVTFVTGARTVKAVVTTAAGAKINQANVFLYADSGGYFPSGASVTITNSGTTATVTHTGHGLVSNDKVWIQGASHDANNGVFSITKINDNSYSYTMGSAPGSDPTGTITSTFTFLKGLTDVNGEISMSRTIPSTQPIKGWARKGSGSPYYKTGSITGNVSSSENTTFSAVLVADE